MAIKDQTRIIKEVIGAILFIKNNFYLVFFTFLIIAVLGAVGAVVYNIIGVAIPRTPYYFLFLSFILQQMLIIFRLFIRMLFCSSEVLLYKDLSAAEVNAELN